MPGIMAYPNNKTTSDIQAFVRSHVKAIVAWLILAILAGPLGELGAYLWGLWVEEVRPLSVGTIVVISTICFGFVLISFLWLYQRSITAERERQLNYALNVANSLITSDDTLLSLLPGLFASRQPDRAIRKLLKEYLGDARLVFVENVSRSTILRPDEKEHLIPWASYQMPQESLTRTRFYVGQDGSKLNGIAGKTFKDRKVYVVRFAQDKSGAWIPDDPDYQNFETKRHDPPYRSFVAVPVLGTEDQCLGVLCFDSPSPTAFDSENVQDLLLAIGRRIATVIRFHTLLASAHRTKGRLN